MKIDFAIILLLLCFDFVVVSSASCGNSQCGQSDECCYDLINGPLCYDPNSFDCVAGTTLCGKGEGACGTTCYDPTLYSCTPTGQLVQGGTNTPLFCSPFSLSPCGANTQCCDNECYDPRAYVCQNSFLCPISATVCGVVEQSCYDPNTQECCNEKLYEKGTSPCSSSGAACCSCSCDSSSFSDTSYTVASGDQCTNQYHTATYGELPCADVTGRCTGDCGVVNCGEHDILYNYCFNNSMYRCNGYFVCSGGPFSCNVVNNGACPAPVTNTGYSETEITDGTTAYEIVPADYQGEVCCWCVAAGEGVATSAPVSDVANCTAAYITELSESSFPYTGCRVWSRFTPYTEAGPNTACGLPE